MSIGRRPALDAGGCRFESYYTDQKINGDAATTAVLRQTVNLFRKVNIVGSNPTSTTKFKKKLKRKLLTHWTRKMKMIKQIGNHKFYKI